MKSESGDHYLNGVCVLFVGLWFADVLVSRSVAEWIDLLFWIAKWCVIIFACLAVIACAIVSATKSPEDSEPAPQVRKIASSFRAKQPSVIEKPVEPSPIPQKENIKPPKPNPGKREAEEALERTAFPLVELTRGAQEALEASLDDF